MEILLSLLTALQPHFELIATAALLSIPLEPILIPAFFEMPLCIREGREVPMFLLYIEEAEHLDSLGMVNATGNCNVAILGFPN